MNATEFASARHRLQLSHVDIAAEFGLTPEIAAELERGTIPVPRSIARDLEWRVAAADRDAAMEASGLPACGWIREWEESVAQRGRPSSKELQSVDRHAQSCPVCQARIAYAEQLPALPPYPATGIAGLVQAVMLQIMRFPEWARPVATGAILFAAYTLVKGGLALASQPTPQNLADFGIAMIISPALGALCGLVYTAFKRVRRSRRPA